MNESWSKVEQKLNKVQQSWKKVEQKLIKSWTKVEQKLNKGWTKVEQKHKTLLYKVIAVNTTQEINYKGNNIK